MITTTTHSQTLAAAASITAAARSVINDHQSLAAEVARLKQAAAAGQLDETAAAEFLNKSEALRISFIVLPRKEASLRDALAEEGRAAVQVLTQLAAELEPLAADAAAAADALTAGLIHPAALELRGDRGAGYQRDTGRSIVESYFHGTFPAAALNERIQTALSASPGAVHVPAAAREIAASFDTEATAIRDGTAMLKAALKAALKLSR